MENYLIGGMATLLFLADLCVIGMLLVRGKPEQAMHLEQTDTAE